MRTGANPFTDPGEIRGPLYATADRLASRTSALHRARVGGRHVADVIADLAHDPAIPDPAVIADLGCGRGTTTVKLAERFPEARIAAIDLSASLLATTRRRLPGSRAVGPIRADFHCLPLADGSCGLIVAAFCLYHSASPASVITEIARCLTGSGSAVIAVKSADSYRELDYLMTASGLDPSAETRPSLYQAAHSGNIEALAASALNVRQVVHETHQFVFPTLADVAEYLATSPKYQLPQSLAGSPAALAAALQNRVTEKPVPATSIVTYLIAGRELAA